MEPVRARHRRNIASVVSPDRARNSSPGLARLPTKRPRATFAISAQAVAPRTGWQQRSSPPAAALKTRCDIRMPREPEQSRQDRSAERTARTEAARRWWQAKDREAREQQTLRPAKMMARRSTASLRLRSKPRPRSKQRAKQSRFDRLLYSARATAPSY